MFDCRDETQGIQWVDSTEHIVQDVRRNTHIEHLRNNLVNMLVTVG